MLNFKDKNVLIGSYVISCVIGLLTGFFWANVLSNHTYGEKTAKEWHNLYAESKIENQSLTNSKSDYFDKLIKLETCVKSYDEQKVEVRSQTPVEAYCLLFEVK